MAQVFILLQGLYLKHPVWGTVLVAKWSFCSKSVPNTGLGSSKTAVQSLAAMGMAAPGVLSSSCQFSGMVFNTTVQSLDLIL